MHVTPILFSEGRRSLFQVWVAVGYCPVLGCPLQAACCQLFLGCRLSPSSIAALRGAWRKATKPATSPKKEIQCPVQGGVQCHPGTYEAAGACPPADRFSCRGGGAGLSAAEAGPMNARRSRLIFPRCDHLTSRP